MISIGSAYVIIYALGRQKPTTCFSVFCVVGSGQGNVLDDGRKELTEHPYPEGNITGHLVFNLTRILVKCKIDAADGVFIRGQGDPLHHAINKISPQICLVSSA